jgi:hypothetical protein
MKKLILTILLAAGTLSVHAGYYGYPCGWGWGFYPSVSFSFGAYPWYSAWPYPVYPVYPVYNYGVAYVRPAPAAASRTSTAVNEAPANTPADSNAPPGQKTAPVSPAADPMSSANSLFGR